MVIDDVVSAVQNYLSYQTWDWSQTVRRNNLIKVIGSCYGVAYLESMSQPSADVTYADVTPLVVAGNVDVTVDQS